MLLLKHDIVSHEEFQKFKDEELLKYQQCTDRKIYKLNKTIKNMKIFGLVSVLVLSICVYVF